MQICVLASGSSGNCTLVRTPRTTVLIDAGLSARETSRRLARLGLDPAALQAIVVSHEHSDHTTGLGVLHRRYGMPLYANRGTVDGLRRRQPKLDLPWTLFTTGAPFTIGDLTLEPFAVPHDAYEPVAFVLRAAACCVGIVTDLGMTTHVVRERLRTCQALVLETNHDLELLRAADRPWSLKQRIAGRQGHLSNDGAAELVVELARGGHLRQVFLAHLSRDCNAADLARETLARALRAAGLAEVLLSGTYPDRISAVWEGARFSMANQPETK